MTWPVTIEDREAAAARSACCCAVSVPPDHTKVGTPALMVRVPLRSASVKLRVADAVACPATSEVE